MMIFFHVALLLSIKIIDYPVCMYPPTIKWYLESKSWLEGLKKRNKSIEKLHDGDEK